jgi:hypothetical protein
MLQSPGNHALAAASMKTPRAFIELTQPAHRRFSMNLILLVVLAFLLFGGGYGMTYGGWGGSGYAHYGYGGFGLGTILLIVFLVLLLR